MRVNTKFYIVGMLLIMYLGGCKPQKSDPNPCLNTTEFKADFKIEEQVGNNWVESDTMLINYIRFRATADYDSYRWTVGNDNRVFTTKQFGLQFSRAEIGQEIEVTLIATGKKTPCFPNDDGIDTLRKKIRLIDGKQSTIVGEYEGYVEGRPNDIFTVKIQYILDYDNEPWYFIRNINKGCTGGGNPNQMLYGQNISNMGISDCNVGGKSLAFDWFGKVGTGCRSPKGLARLITPNRIQIDYIIGDLNPVISPNFITTNERFVGIRK